MQNNHLIGNQLSSTFLQHNGGIHHGPCSGVFVVFQVGPPKMPPKRLRHSTKEPRARLVLEPVVPPTPAAASISETEREEEFLTNHCRCYALAPELRTLDMCDYCAGYYSFNREIAFDDAKRTIENSEALDRKAKHALCLLPDLIRRTTRYGDNMITQKRRLEFRSRKEKISLLREVIDQVENMIVNTKIDYVPVSEIEPCDEQLCDDQSFEF